MPAVDILLPVRNGKPYISDSIKSILHQSWRDWRLIVLDHGSNDGTQEICEDFSKNDSRVIVRSFPDANGLSDLLNRGLKLCDAAYVMRQDADDISLPNRIVQSVEAFSANPDVTIIGGAAELIDGSGRSIGDRSMPCDVADIQAATLFGNPIIHPTLMFDLNKFIGVGAEYGTSFLAAPNHGEIKINGLAEDYLLFGQFAILGKCINLNTKLIKYRIHSNSESESKVYAQRECALRISRYLCECWANLSDCRSFDTAPFCNFGELFHITDKTQFYEEYDLLEKLLYSSVKDCVALRRNLAFSKVLADRRSIPMMFAYMKFAFQFGVVAGERHAIRKWIINRELKHQVTSRVYL